MNPFLDHQRIVHRRTWGQRMLLAINLLLVASCFLLATSLGYGARRVASVNRVALDRSLTALPTSARGDRVMNILLVGSDSSANLDADDPIQIGRHGERSGDVIIIAHLDERDGSVTLLSLPRDLWVTMAGSDRKDRINRAFLVGGPATLIDTIEENFDIPIHHYVNVDFAGFQGLVEAVGSVDVFFEAPARDWNVNANPPRSQTGFLVSDAGCQTLDPVQALAYVRSRYYQTQDSDGRWVTDPSSDLGRIQRQQDFLRRLLQKAIDMGARNPLVLKDLIDTGISNVAIDGQLTPGLLVDVSGTYRNFDPADLQSYTFPVADATVGSRKVLTPRMSEVGPLLELLRGTSGDDPATVGVELVFDPSLAGTASGPGGGVSVPRPVANVADALETAGFDLGDDDPVARPVNGSPGTIEPGIQVRYGAGGRAAAELVARSLASAPTSSGQPLAATLVETTGIAARHVVVTVGDDAGPGSGTDHFGPGTVPGLGTPVTEDQPNPIGPGERVDPATEDRQSRPSMATCS